MITLQMPVEFEIMRCDNCDGEFAIIAVLDWGDKVRWLHQDRDGYLYCPRCGAHGLRRVDGDK